MSANSTKTLMLEILIFIPFAVAVVLGDHWLPGVSTPLVWPIIGFALVVTIRNSANRVVLALNAAAAAAGEVRRLAQSDPGGPKAAGFMPSEG